MAGKCKEMNKIKQALRLHLDGETNRSIGRKLDLYKGTVNKYVNMAKACGIPIPELLAMEEPEIERVLTGGNPAYSDSRFQDLKDRLQYIAAELQRKHVTMYLLWREYRTEMPDGYGYTQFCYHVNQFTEAQKPSFVLSPDREGGQYLFVDFAGDTLSYVDLDTGEAVKCQVFVATLPASDYGFAMAVPSQKVDDFLYAMECYLRHIGGVPKIIVTDNLKSAVVKADRYEPEVNRSYRTGEYVCDKSHLPSYYNDYVRLSPSKYIQRAERVSTLFGEVIRGVFGQNTSVPPETYYKSCDGLFSLQRTTDPDLFERACAAALERHRCNYGFIKNLIGSKCAGLLAESGEPVLFPADHENIRGREYIF